MSRFSGRQGRGAMRTVREQKRHEADERQAHFEERVAGLAATEGIPLRDARRQLARRIVLGGAA